jgi:hypothetical protein
MEILVLIERMLVAEAAATNNVHLSSNKLDELKSKLIYTELSSSEIKSITEKIVSDTNFYQKEFEVLFEQKAIVKKVTTSLAALREEFEVLSISSVKLKQTQTQKMSELNETLDSKNKQISELEAEIFKLGNNNTVLKNDNTELVEYKKSVEAISTTFIDFLESIKKYWVYFKHMFEVDKESDGVSRIHERFTSPFVFTVVLFTFEAWIIHSHFWGSKPLALAVLAVLNMLAYADQHSVIPFVRYEGLKRLKKLKASAIANGVEFVPSFETISDIYKNKVKTATFNVVTYLGFFTGFISLTQFLFDGYHYDDVLESTKLNQSSSLEDLLNKFYYVYTYKNVFIALFLGFLASYNIRISVRLQLPKIYQQLLKEI